MFQTTHASTTAARLLRLTLFAVALMMLGVSRASAHQLWIETAPAAQRDISHEIQVCWGHSGERTAGKMLESQRDKLSVQVLGPDGSRAYLENSQRADYFAATATPTVPGYYVLGAELQTGIISRQLHSIPPNTRIVMYGKTLTHLAGSEDGMLNALGFDLEIIPLTAPGELRRGGVARAKLLFKGKPLGGRNVEISLGTAGTEPLPLHRRIQSHEWSIDATPDPQSGEVAFPLIAGGQHQFMIRYFDETPGTYSGDRDDHSDFSHLRKGDTFERTMYVSTLTIQVGAE
jgi:uncharacterized GH25 family protein